MIKYDPLRHTVPHDYSSYEQLSKFLRWNCRLTWHKINAFRHTINECCNSVITLVGQGQVRNDIYHTLFEHLVRNTQRLQETWWLLSGYFGSLTHPTSTYISSTIMIHAFLPVMFIHCTHHVIQPQVACHRAVMVLGQQVTVQVINVSYHKCDLITITQTVNQTIT